MAYAMLSSYGKQNRSISAAAAVLRGYHSVYPLPYEERQHLPLLMACRLSCSVTLGAFSFSQNPANTYLLLHAEPAWKALDLIWGKDPEKRELINHCLQRMFAQACNIESLSIEEDIPCSDLALPDPSVTDHLKSLRLADP